MNMNMQMTVVNIKYLKNFDSETIGGVGFLGILPHCCVRKFFLLCYIKVPVLLHSKQTFKYQFSKMNGLPEKYEF